MLFYRRFACAAAYGLAPLTLAIPLTGLADWPSAIAFPWADTSPPAPPTETLCGQPPLDNLKQHRVVKGETLESIAKRYKLAPATVMGFNPPTRTGQVHVGQVLSLPPTDGIAYEVGNDDSYRSISKQFGVRADRLFESNACRVSPRVVFVPGVLWKPDPVIPPLPDLRPDEERSLPPVIIGSGGYPLPYLVPVTSKFGWRLHPITGDWSFHSGLDLGAPMGTPVLAVKAGRVVFAGDAGGYGNLIEIDHGGIGTRYAHLSAIAVRVGQRVAKGQLIGNVGSTGRSTGPHLHFEIRVPTGGRLAAVDPAPYIAKLASAFRDTVAAAVKRQVESL